MSEDDSVAPRYIAIGVNPAEKDGTVSFLMALGVDRQYVAMPWRDAVGFLVALHHTIHEAAHDAGASEEELFEYMDAAFDAAHEEASGE